MKASECKSSGLSVRHLPSISPLTKPWENRDHMVVRVQGAPDVVRWLASSTARFFGGGDGD